VTLKSFNQIEKELQKLQFQKAEALKEYDYNLFLFNELEEAQLVSGELQELENEYESLNNVEEIKEELLLSNQLLSEEQMGILNSMTLLKNSLQKLSKLSKTYQELFNRVNSALIELDDVFAEIEDAQGNLEANPNRLEEVNLKLQKIHNLLLKHSASDIDELIEIKIELSNKVLATETIDNQISEKENTLKTLEQSLNKLAENLHKKRSKAIPELSNQLEGILADLGMENAKFKISLLSQEDFFSNGKDKLNFLFTANKGGEFKLLKKAASGGELSRIMLAVKSILAKYIQLPSIMFDEIDTGVSGEISNKMAAIMQQMSKSMQVFTITHLPQIAAKGDTHFKVYKEDLNNKTITQMIKLNADERIVEIAQMLGGKEMSTSAIAHAKQLLN
jgi:DNA repair protein RecN (Recombination protein N)